MNATVRPALYGDVIRERWRRPRFRGDLADATATAEDVNPLCGDRVRLQLRLEDGRVRAARFAGDSCAICTASADVVAELAEGRVRGDAAAIIPSRSPAMKRCCAGTIRCAARFPRPCSSPLRKKAA